MSNTFDWEDWEQIYIKIYWNKYTTNENAKSQQGKKIEKWKIFEHPI